MKAKITRGNDPRGAIAYILGKGDRSRLIGGTVSGLTVIELTEEFRAIIGQRPDIRKPVWAASLTLPEGDHLTDGDWNRAAERFLKKMGMPEDTLYAIVRHSDTTHDHVHILTSRVSVSGRVWEPWQDVYRAIEATQELEQELGLTRTPGYDPSEGKKGLTHGEYWQSDRKDEDPVRFRLQALVDEALAKTPTVPEFVRSLEASGVTVRPNLASTGRLSGFSFELDGITFKGSQLGKAYGLKGLMSRGLSYVPEREVERGPNEGPER